MNLKELAGIYRVKKDEHGQFTSKEKAKTIAEWWNEGGKEKTGGALSD